MQKNFFVSVIIPVYNSDKFIGRCLRSIKKQTLDKKNYEIIVIDDCSTDNTLTVVRKLESEFDFKLISNSTNQGLMKTNNIGVKASSGEFLMILGHDDLLAPNHITLLLKDFKSSDVMFLFSIVLWSSSMISE